MVVLAIEIARTVVRSSRVVVVVVVVVVAQIFLVFNSRIAGDSEIIVRCLLSLKMIAES